MAGDLALASYHDLKGKMIMQVNMKKGTNILLSAFPFADQSQNN